MTVPSAVDYIFYDGNGATTVFPIPFKIFAAADLRVVLIAADGTPTLQALTTHYTIPTADLGDSEGNATMLTAPAAGAKLLLRRARSYVQSSRFRDNSDYNAGLHETALDAALMASQRLAYDVGRALKLPETEASVATLAEIPKVATRANTYLHFNAAGAPEYVTAASILTNKMWTREGALTTTGNDLFPQYTAFGSETYTRLHIRVHVAPTGSSVVVELLKNGVTVVGSVTLAAGQLSALATGLSISLVDGDYIQPQIASVGSSTPGTTMTLTMRP